MPFAVMYLRSGPVVTVLETGNTSDGHQVHCPSCQFAAHIAHPSLDGIYRLAW